MKTEADRSLKHGFVLTEQELRRLITSIKQQMEAGTSQRQLEESFQVKFRNGAVSEPADIDEVLALENFGTSAITRLAYDVTLAGEDLERVVSFSFVDSLAEKERAPVRYRVMGLDRDWVFVTSSMLDERISRMRIPNYRDFLDARLMFSVGSIVVTLSMILGLTASIGSSSGLEALWKAGRIKDPIEAMIYLDKEHTGSLGPWVSTVIIWGLGYAALAVLVSIALPALWPMFNFCWGDYAGSYEKKVLIRRFIVGTVITGLLVSVLAGVISNRLRF